MVALGVVAGCGGESRGVGATPDDRAAAGTVTNWLSALVAGDDARACSYLTPSLRRAIDRHIRIRAERGSCRDWAAKWLGGTKPPGHRDARVTGVRVRDAAATVTVEAA